MTRLQREETQQSRRVLAKAQGDVTLAAASLARARDEMSKEEALAAANPDIANPFYLPHAQARVHELAARLAHLQREEDRARSKVLTCHRREKLSEKLVARRKTQELLEETKQEQKEAASLAESITHNKVSRQ